MTLSDLIMKGGLSDLMAATPATVATVSPSKTITVATVATVAVNTTENTPSERLEDSIILLCLEHIGETDPTEIAEVLNECKHNLQTRQYYLKRARELPISITTTNDINSNG